MLAKYKIKIAAEHCIDEMKKIHQKKNRKIEKKLIE